MAGCPAAATGYADVTIRLRRKWPKNLSGDCGATPVYECEIGADIRDVNGAVVPSDVTLAKADAATHQWMHTWGNLPKTDQKTGLNIIYWIDELSVDVAITQKSRPDKPRLVNDISPNNVCIAVFAVSPE